MVKACSAPGCKYQHRKGDGLKMHSFPSNTEINKQWLKAMKKENCLNYPSKTSVICSQHFKAHCYNTTSGFLKRDAIPSIFYESRSIRPIDHEIGVIAKCTDGIQHDSLVEEYPTRYTFDDSELTESNDTSGQTSECILIKIIPDKTTHCLMTDTNMDINDIQTIELDNETNKIILMQTKSNIICDEDNIILEDDGIVYDPCLGGTGESINNENGYEAEVMKNRKQLHFIGDFIFEDLENDVQRRKYWLKTHKVHEDQQKKLKYYSNRMHALEKRIDCLTKEIMLLKKNGNPSSDNSEKKLFFSAHKRKMLW